MSIINTNINALTGLSNLRKTNLSIRNSLEKLSSGYAINKASDDPSGLAISVGMQAQTRGMDVAIQNAQDTINMIQTADGALHETSEILQRMRDIAVRGANQAASSTWDQQKLYAEYQSLAVELVRKSDAVTFNTKNLLNNSDFFDEGVGDPITMQVTQIGADDAMSFRVNINIESIALFQSPMGAGTMDMNAFVNTFGNEYVAQDPVGMYFDLTLLAPGTPPPDVADGFRNLIDFTQGMIDETARIRANLGVKQRRLDHIVNDLTVQNINISASRSKIMDANMAVEISGFTKSQILQQSGTAILAQANAQPQSVLQLLQ